ncbi:MAG: CsgG/HfaB family protein [Bacteroidetes bacterium]|nr:CsgG/HfaB family protein [Bacteroidota bacterium]
MSTRMSRLSVLVAILLLPMIGYSQGALDQRIGELSQQIASEMTQNQKTTIAVVEFSDLQGNVTDFGRYLAEELVTRLFQTGKFKVIERQLLNKVVHEQKLSLTGLVDPNTAKQLGRILGVDAIVSGTITDLAQSLKVNARLISTETGEIFAVASVEIFKDESVMKLMSSGTGGPTEALGRPAVTVTQPTVNPNYVVQKHGLKITVVSIKKELNTVIMVLSFENMETKQYNAWLWGSGGYTYLLDDEGRRWNLQDESAGLRSSVTLIPGTQLTSRFKFVSNDQDATGKVFTLIMKLDRSTEASGSGNPIDLAINNLSP